MEYISSGGLIGRAIYAEIENCYAMATSIYEEMAGLVGEMDESTIKRSYWNINANSNELVTISGDDLGIDTATVKGLTTTQMKSTDSYSGWDFTDTWGIDANKNDGFPYLKALPDPPVSEVEITIPATSGLSIINYPNPFNPVTTIEFSLSLSKVQENAVQRVTIEIYNIKGQKVRKLADDVYPVGKHSVTWNGTDDTGRTVSSGVYFSRISSAGATLTRKMVLIK